MTIQSYIDPRGYSNSALDERQGKRGGSVDKWIHTEGHNVAPAEEAESEMWGASVQHYVRAT